MKNKARVVQKDKKIELSHCIFIDYSKDVVQYMILDTKKYGFLPLSEKLPSKFAYVNKESILSCKISASEVERKKKEVPMDVLDFLVHNDQSRVFVSKKSDKHFSYEKTNFAINSILSNQTQSNVLVTLN